jgi:hypothetical protein
VPLRDKVTCQTACYQIPEETEELSSEEGGTGGYRGRQSSWRCPLTARAEDLPNGAHLCGTLLDLGAPPCMRTCQLGRSLGLNLCKKLPSCPVAQGFSALEGTVVPGSEDAMGVGDAPHVEGAGGWAGAEGLGAAAENGLESAPCGREKQGYIDWLGNSMRKHAALAGKRVPTDSGTCAAAGDVAGVASPGTEEGGMLVQGSGVVSGASGDACGSVYESASESDAGAEFNTARSWSSVQQ